jgi:hypothetical protein
LAPAISCTSSALPCGHIQTLAEAIFTAAALPDYEKITGLNGRLRCRECGEKGRVDVSIKWAE